MEGVKITKRQRDVIIEGAHIGFKNFSGAEKRNPQGKIVNQEGSRNFTLFLDEEDARDLEETYGFTGFQYKEYEGNVSASLQVKVKFGDYPPSATLISSRKKTKLDEDSIYILDGIRAVNVDLIISPYTWNISNGSHGVAAYLRSIGVVMQEDYIAEKYADIPYDDEFEE